MSFCQFLIWNRDGEGITCLHRDGKGSTSVATNTADLVVYRNSDNTSTVYIKCKNYFTYDLDIQTYQSNATIIYNGTYSTTTPTGTMKVSGAAATTRLELSKDGAVYNGSKLALKSDIGNGTITIQKNGTNVGSFTTNQSGNSNINLALTKNDVGLGNVDNTADQNKSVNYASGAGKIVSQDKNSSFSYEDLL